MFKVAFKAERTMTREVYGVERRGSSTYFLCYISEQWIWMDAKDYQPIVKKL